MDVANKASVLILFMRDFTNFLFEKNIREQETFSKNTRQITHGNSRKSNLATIEAAPNALFLITVGYNSAV